MIDYYTLITIFLIVCVLTLILIWLSHKTELLLKKTDLIGVQKFHKHPTPRIAGISIFIGFFSGIWLEFGFSSLFYGLLVATLPVFLGGLIEDIIARVSPTKRMICALLSISIAFFWFNIEIDQLGFDTVDYLLSNYILISLFFTLFVLAGVINAINIIDGFNGLMIGYCLLVLLALAYIGNTLGDIVVFKLSLLLISSLLGLFVFNFPFGKIFAGDGGAYFIGFMIAIIGLMLGIRNEEVTHWFILLLLIYPLYEAVFSIYRKKIVLGISPSQPDGYHLHMLIYKRLTESKVFKDNNKICNSMTSPFLWVLSSIGIVPAVVWYDNQTILIIWAFIFMAIYTIIYRRLAQL